MQNTSITIRTDKEIKDKVKSLYAALGMDLTTAVNVFFRQSLLHNGMPFELSLDVVKLSPPVGKAAATAIAPFPLKSFYYAY